MTMSGEAFLSDVPGEVAQLMRDLDWTRSPFGPISDWSPALRSAAGICLNSRFPMVLYWGETRALIYNDAWAPVLGEKHPWGLGRAGTEVWAEIWDIIGPMFDQVMNTGQATWSDDQLLPLHRFGYTEECYFYYSYSPVRGEPGLVEGIFTAVTETTYRVLAERRERLSREISEATVVARSAEEACDAALRCLDTLPEEAPFSLAYLYDEDGVTLRRVPRGQDERPEICPQFAPEVIPEGAPAPWPLDELEPRKMQIDVDLGSELPHAPWPEPLAEAVVLPIPSLPGSRPYGYVVFGVSSRRRFDGAYQSLFVRIAGHISTAIRNARAYEAERRRAEQLAALDEAKTIFFSNASHEFRTPLTLMLSPVQAMMERAAGASTVEVSSAELGLVERNGQRLLRLVNSLLDFSRIEAGRAAIAWQPTDLGAMTTDLASAFRSTMELAGLTYTVHAEPLSLPVWIDVDMWEKIVLNLVSNAFKYTLSGGVSVSISDRGDCAEVTVADTGVGIPASDLPLIFERFHRVEGQSGRTFEGTGIGLSLVKELTELQRGSVTVESEVGRGTVFRVRMPYGRPHDLRTSAQRVPLQSTATRAETFVAEAQRWLPDEVRTQDLNDSAGSASISGSPLSGTVLLADDNADMRDYVRRLLEERGLRVVPVADGKEALATLTNVPVDLLLTDVMMPRLNGFELVERLRGMPALQALPVIMLSARAGEEESSVGLRSGADDYLVKPFSARELVTRVEAQLRRSRSLREESVQLAQTNEQLEQTIAQRTRERNETWNIAHDMFGIADRAGVWRAVNPAWCRILGWDEHMFIGRTSEWIEHPDDIRKTREEIHRLAQGVTTFEFENRFRTRNGDFRILSWTATPSGDMIYCVARDITAERERQIEIERSRERALQSQKMEAIGQLTGGVAHDFNNVLQVIGGNLQLLRRELPAEPLASRIDTAYSAVERGGRLASQLLAFARRHPIAPVVVHLGRLIDNMDELLRHALGEANDVIVHYPSDLWNARVDRAHMENALLNLVINARDAMTSAGTMTLRLQNREFAAAQPQLDGLRAGQYVQVSVSDTGCGMPPEVKAKVFEPFFSTKPEGKGTGLGMSMVYGFVRQAGGHIFLESEVAEGTTVSFWLPAVFDEESPLVRELEESPAGHGERVLVVEDDASVRRTVIDMLRTIGYETVEAENADAAARLLRSGVVIDLLFTDVVMPGKMTSMELAALARKTHPHVAILFTSGYAENRIAHGGLLDAGVQLLSKPYTSATLARRLRQVLASAPSGAVRQTIAGPLSTKASRAARILLVEDDENLREATVALLSSLPWQVIDCPSAEAAFRVFEAEGGFDLLVTDVSLPDMDGFKLAHALREKRPALPAIFITGYGRHDISANMSNAQVIRKPFDIDLLEQAITRAISPG